MEYADRFELEAEIIRRNSAYEAEPPMEDSGFQEAGEIQHDPAQETDVSQRRKDPVRIE